MFSVFFIYAFVGELQKLKMSHNARKLSIYKTQHAVHLEIKKELPKHKKNDSSNQKPKILQFAQIKILKN
jgi:hypothetical protein